MSWIGILLAFTGLMLLAAPSSTEMTLSLGEIRRWPAPMAAEIILIGAFAGKVIRRVTIVQLATASLASFLMMAPTGESPPPYPDYLPQRHWAGAGQRVDSIDHELGAAQRFADAGHGDLRRRTGLGGIVGRLAGERLPGVALLGAP